jgi:aryl-alcohol dehydrogenase-like predicted oxidoreductase
MKKRILGKTGLMVSELSLGGFFTSSFGGHFEQSKAAIEGALKLGMNFIDTAPNYANSEEVIGKVLDGLSTDEPLIISDKVGGKPEPFDARDKGCIMSSIENSLKTLHRDHIDILMLHEPDRPGQYDWWTDKENYDGPVLELLGDLKKQGVIRYIGIAGTTAYELADLIRSDKFDVVQTAFNYSLLWREAELEIIPEAAKRNMGIVIGSPLQMGALAAKYNEVYNGAKWLNPPRRDQFKKLYALSDELNMPLAEMGLRFVLSDPRISCALTGVRSVEEVRMNTEFAEKGPLPADVLTRIDEIAAMVPFRPFEEPFALPFGHEYRGPGIVNSSWI